MTHGIPTNFYAIHMAFPEGFGALDPVFDLDDAAEAVMEADKRHMGYRWQVLQIDTVKGEARDVTEWVQDLIEAMEMDQ